MTSTFPERFELSYIGEDGKQHQPFMIHRALLGSMERFFGVLLEHFSGAFPVWLAPVQAVVLPIAEKHQEFAENVRSYLAERGIRTEVDQSSNTLNYRIRNAQTSKIPYMLVIGDREEKAGSVAVRVRSEEDLGAIPLKECVDFIRKKIETKAHH